MGELDSSLFEIVGPDYRTWEQPEQKPSLLFKLKQLPWIPIVILSAIVLGCIFANFISNHDPSMYYLNHLNEAPNSEFYFGTDSLGRDIYSLIWYGGRTSLLVGLLGTAMITILGITYGCVNGTAGTSGDMIMQRFVELFHSIPTILLAILLIAIMGTQNILTISVVIAITGWFALARIVRSEVRQIRNNEYVLAAKSMGSSFGHLVRVHLIPNIIPAIMFVVVSSISACITMEATLSFLGLGLPLDILSWGSMLSLANRALLLNTWWVIIIPGLFLVVTLSCITTIANCFRKETNKRPNRL
ncbi:MAG: ABC transporter permease [Methanocorpusculum sp.]|uniref:ABC transporter permease n=1 Tax=Methanocorpusculum sp. TaxID=2058474 RepID=UPI00271DA614|nr:ABC transporter permease [Methanocorpusculum sp.]MDO9522304.1 ABC transporter permease [Methanocorpusculum sp.]